MEHQNPDTNHSLKQYRTSTASVDTDVTQVDSSILETIYSPSLLKQELSHPPSLTKHIPDHTPSPTQNDSAHNLSLTKHDPTFLLLHNVDSNSNSDAPRLCGSCVPGAEVKGVEPLNLEAKNREAEVRRRRRLVVWMVTLLCLGGIVQGVIVNGLINVVISSLEKRFGLLSTESGLVASSYDVASFFCLLPVSYLGGRGTGKKPAWIGGGILLMGLGSLLFSLPHFISEEYTVTLSQDSSVSYCNLSMPCSSEQTGGENNQKYVFMVAQLLHGAGAAPLYTLGVTYIDENVGVDNSAFYLGVFYTMAIVGPAIGYAMGGQLLKIHTDFISVDVMEVDGDGWVGAWWVGFLVCGLVALILSVLVVLLPPALPGLENPPADQVCTSRLPSRASSFRTSFRKPAGPRRAGPADDIDLAAGGGGPLPVGRELISALLTLFTNPTFVCISLAGASEGFLMQGLATFLPKLLENQYNLTESQAAMNVGAVSVLAGGGGTLLGGIIVNKFSLKVPGLLKLTSLTQCVAIVAALGLLASCPVDTNIKGAVNTKLKGAVDKNIKGGVDSYKVGNATELEYQTEDCGSGCNCTSYDYNPVCVVSEQYLNPCWAGCTGFSPAEGLYHNCSCAATEGVQGSGDTTGTPGLCPSTCSFLPTFLTSFFFTMLITFMANMPTLTATLRCVDPAARSLALGIQWLFIRLLGTIPGPVAMGKLFDWNCERWRAGCQGPQNCLTYDNTNLSKLLMILTAFCKSLSILAFLIGMRMYKSPAVAVEKVYAEQTSIGTFDAEGVHDIKVKGVQRVRPQGLPPVRPQGVQGIRLKQQTLEDETD